MSERPTDKPKINPTPYGEFIPPWRVGDAVGGIAVQVLHSHGCTLLAIDHSAAGQIADVLNGLERWASFGVNCYQDHCENAYVETTIHKAELAQRDAQIAALREVVEKLVLSCAKLNEEQAKVGEHKGHWHVYYPSYGEFISYERRKGDGYETFSEAVFAASNITPEQARAAGLEVENGDA